MTFGTGQQAADSYTKTIKHSSCFLMLKASCLTLEINEFRCYEAKIEAEHWQHKPEVSWVQFPA